jgi:hypothetical protein
LFRLQVLTTLEYNLTVFYTDGIIAASRGKIEKTDVLNKDGAAGFYQADVQKLK